MRISSLFCLLAGVVVTPVATAEVVRIPTESGWSGRIGFGLSYGSYSSNLVAGSKFSDGAENQVASVEQGPGSITKASPSPFFDFRYTFAEQRGQAYLGFLIQDAVRLDFAQQLGYRQELKGNGIVSAAFLFSGIPSQVWQDPYVEGERREEVDRVSTGARLAWNQVAGSPFSVTYSYRKVEIDDEKSGQWAVANDLITAQEQELLARDGNNHAFELNYRFNLSRQSFLMPALKYIVRDRDGAAMAGDSLGAQLTYSSFGRGQSYILNAYLGKRSYDQLNPIYNQKTDATEWALNGNWIFHRPLGYKNWDAMLSASYAETDSKVNFHDMDASGIRFTALYSF